jgi:hypothetical protein
MMRPALRAPTSKPSPQIDSRRRHRTTRCEHNGPIRAQTVARRLYRHRTGRTDWAVSYSQRSIVKVIGTALPEPTAPRRSGRRLRRNRQRSWPIPTTTPRRYKLAKCEIIPDVVEKRRPPAWGRAAITLLTSRRGSWRSKTPALSSCATTTGWPDLNQRIGHCWNKPTPQIV